MKNSLAYPAAVVSLIGALSLSACSSDSQETAEPKFAGASGSAAPTSSEVSQDSSADESMTTEASESSAAGESSAEQTADAGGELNEVDGSKYMVNQASAVFLVHDGHCLIKDNGQYVSCQFPFADAPLLNAYSGMEPANAIRLNEGGVFEYSYTAAAGLPGGGVGDSAPQHVEPGTTSTIQGLTVTYTQDEVLTVTKGSSWFSVDASGHATFG